jgi:hypothetical protein
MRPVADQFDTDDQGAKGGDEKTSITTIKWSGGGTGGRSRGIFSAAELGSSVQCVIGKGGAGSSNSTGADGLP